LSENGRNRGRRARNGTPVARSARTTTLSPDGDGSQLGQRVRPVFSDHLPGAAPPAAGGIRIGGMSSSTVSNMDESLALATLSTTDGQAATAAGYSQKNSIPLPVIKSTQSEQPESEGVRTPDAICRA
jgi:hypothetical protein